jgi:predicted  nucleic acid-binding Zn-ribbon protein
MMRTADLWRLQETDSALDARRGTIEDARARIGESEEIEAARADLAEKAKAHRAAEATQKDLELQADDVKSKIAPAEEKLYSGSIKNPKELADLQHDVDQHKRQLSAIEDQDIEALSAVEAAEGELRAAREALEGLEAAWRDEQAELGDRIARLTAEVEEYEVERGALAGEVEPDLLRTYDHVRRAHRGKGVAKLDRNLCLGCRISLPVSTVNKARAGSALVQCPNCERILCA